MRKHDFPKCPIPATRNGKSCVILIAHWKHLLRNYGEPAANIFLIHNGFSAEKPRYRVKAISA